MKKIVLGILIAVALTVLAVSVAFALPQNKGGVKAPPEFVPELPESELTKIVFIRYAPGLEPICDNDGICEPRENWKNCPNDCKKEEEPTTACYAFLSGAKPRWNWVEDYVYNDGSLAGPSSNAVTTWEAPVSGDIFGDGVPGNYKWGVYDYQNSISFGNYEDPNVIAVTAIWFRAKNIYEYDIMFDIDYLPSEKKIDLSTVILHEFGHGAGLNDLYDTTCVSEVMFGIYDGVDLDLGPGDTVGIQTLYGSK